MRIDLDKIEATARKATPGTWRWDPDDESFGALQDEESHWVSLAYARVDEDSERAIIDIATEDAEHIANCSPDAVLKLLRVVKAARRAVADYRSDTPDGGAAIYALCKAVDGLDEP